MRTEAKGCRSDRIARSGRPSGARQQCLGLLAIAALTGCYGEPFTLVERSVDGGATAASSTGSGGDTEADSDGDGGDVAPAIFETVEVVDASGQAMIGLDLVVNDADGALLGRTTTDAQGRALADVPPRGSVSVLAKYNVSVEGTISTIRNIRTVAGLPEGATHRIVLEDSSTQPPENQAMDGIEIETDVGFQLGLGWKIALSCRYESLHAIGTYGTYVPNYTGCPGETTYDVFIFPVAGSQTTYGVLLDQPLQPGVALTHTLAISDMRPIAPLTSKILPIPFNSLRVSMYLFGYRTGRTSPVIDHKHFPSPNVMGETVFLRLPGGIFSKYRLVEELLLQEAPLRRMSRHSRGVTTVPPISTWTPGFVATVDDLASPDLTTITEPVLRWNLSATGSLGDWIEARQEWSPSEYEHTTWMVVQAPARAGSARFPELPDELSEYRLKSGDALGGSAVDHVDVAVVDGFAHSLEGYDPDAETTRNSASKGLE